MQTESWQTGSSRYTHIHTLAQLAEMFRREELTYIAKGALKKKGIIPSVLSEMMLLKRKESYYEICLQAIKYLSSDFSF